MTSVFRFANFLFWISLCTVLHFSSCVDHDFDNPPQLTDELDFTANSSIAELKSYYVSGQFVTIPADLRIHAVVVADDRSGNFYKTIVIQDSTGGIELKINQTGIYSSFPIGMKVGIKCKGLTLGDYNGLIQIGLGTYLNGTFTNLSGIEPSLLGQYVFKGPKNQPVVPHKRTINTLTAQDVSTLVSLDAIEFKRTEIGKTFADVVGGASSNLLLTDCSKNEIILRSSNFADFASKTVPDSNGTVVGILGKYRTDVQLFIRDLNDMSFHNPPCGTAPSTLKKISIKSLRSLYSGTTLSAPDSSRITGTLISDKDHSNITSKNIVLQDETGGITVRFTATNTFAKGDQIEIDISKQELSEFQGLLQLNNLDLGRARKTGTQTVTASPKTIAQILSDFENLESTLIEINDVTISKSSGSTFSGTCKLTDATGTLDLFTQSYADFAAVNFPTGKVKLVGFLNQGGTSMAKQISIRDPSDISSSGGGGNPVFISILDLRKSFTGSTTSVPDNKKIKGIVISDRSTENTTLKNVHIQDATGGIVVRFVSNHTFNLGDELEIDISGQEFTEFQGLLEINNVPNERALVTGSGTVTPALKKLSDILQDFENLESTLVVVEDVTISKVSGTSFSGTCIIDDGTAQMELYTRTAATFANDNFPTGKVKIIGIVNQGGTALAKQISIRFRGDITP